MHVELLFKYTEVMNNAFQTPLDELDAAAQIIGHVYTYYIPIHYMHTYVHACSQKKTYSYDDYQRK